MELVIIILLLLLIIMLFAFFDYYFQESLRKVDRQARYIKEHLKLQQDFINAYKDMLRAAHRAEMQNEHTWNNQKNR